MSVGLSRNNTKHPTVSCFPRASSTWFCCHFFLDRFHASPSFFSARRSPHQSTNHQWSVPHSTQSSISCGRSTVYHTTWFAVAHTHHIPKRTIGSDRLFRWPALFSCLVPRHFIIIIINTGPPAKHNTHTHTHTQVPGSSHSQTCRSRFRRPSLPLCPCGRAVSSLSQHVHNKSKPQHAHTHTSSVCSSAGIGTSPWIVLRGPMSNHGQQQQHQTPDRFLFS